MKDEYFKNFVKEHIDHEKFKLSTQTVSTGYGMNESEECRIYAECKHDDVELVIWLKK